MAPSCMKCSSMGTRCDGVPVCDIVAVAVPLCETLGRSERVAVRLMVGLGVTVSVGSSEQVRAGECARGRDFGREHRMNWTETIQNKIKV